MILFERIFTQLHVSLLTIEIKWHQCMYGIITAQLLDYAHYIPFPRQISLAQLVFYSLSLSLTNLQLGIAWFSNSFPAAF